MKRILLILLTLLMAFSLFLAACGKDEEPSAAESSEASEESRNESNGSRDESGESQAESDESRDESNESHGESGESRDESENSPDESDSSRDDVTSAGSSENSKENPETESSENPGIIEDDPPGDPVELLFTRYTEGRKGAVLFGTCAMDAEVTVTVGSKSITVKSYMGYFAATFENTASSFDATFTQTVNGKPCGAPKTYRATPEVSAMAYEQEVIASNGAFQFFLSKMIPDYEGWNLFDDGSISSMVSRIKGRMETVHSYNPNAEIIYMIVPSPMTIYPELVPDVYTKAAKGNTRLDQVLSGLNKTGATVIDLRDTFKAHKNDAMPLYYKMDSHWADYGAYLAYVELFKHISKKFPDAAPRGMNDFKWTAGYYKSADVIMYLGYPQSGVQEYGYYREYNVSIPDVINTFPRYRLPQLLYSDESTYEFYMETGRSNLPSCMVFRDSYGAGVYDLIPERMNTTHYIGMWNYSWNNRQIQSEQPDYIIYLIAEWNLHEVVYR